MKIYFETKPGQDLVCLGSIDELNNWKYDKLKPNMTWTEGHIWQLTEPIITKEPVFRYKYYLIDECKEGFVSTSTLGSHFETGIDRIANLRLIVPERQPHPQLTILDDKGDEVIQQPRTALTPMSSSKDLKYITINDEWETFNVKFTIFYPLATAQDELIVNTDFEGHEYLKMKKATYKTSWMFHKYG